MSKLRRTIVAGVLVAGGLAASAGIAYADSPSTVVGNGTWYVIDTDANTTGNPFSRFHDESQVGPVHHGREVMKLGSDRAIKVISGSCKTVDPDGTVWGPIRTEHPGDTVTCYGSDND